MASENGSRKRRRADEDRPEADDAQTEREPADSDPDLEGVTYGILEARPEPNDVPDAQGAHYHYLLEFCHTHPGSHEKKPPNWRGEHVIELGLDQDPRLGLLPAEFEAFLDDRVRFGVKVGLENTRALLSRLGLDTGLPPVILVGGTNGKGTVAHALGEAFSVAGYRPGVYTSPHVERFLERIQVANADPDDAAVEDSCRQVREAVEALDAEGVRCTYFEVGTALALAVFRAQRASPLILEVGMGGRGDAVNAVEPIASIITNVGSDHAEHLGAELGARVTEKAGILRAGKPCFTAAEGEAARLLGQAAVARGARLVSVVPPGSRMAPEDAALALVRTVVADPNVRAALPKLLDLDPVSVRLPRLPGRQEPFLLPGGRVVLLDVAHNAEAIDHLASALDEVALPAERQVLLVGLLRDKPVDAVARLARGRFGKIVVTRPQGERARDASELAAALAEEGIRADHVVEDAVRALGIAIGETPEDGRLVVAGSFYLAAVVRPHLRRAGRRV